MINAIVYCLLVVLVLAGIVSSLYLLLLLALRPKAIGRLVVVIPPAAAEADIAGLLCAARLRLGLMGDLCRAEVIALDCGMPKQSRAQCEALCRELDHTALLTPEELTAQMKTLAKK
ncbi:MAG: hypothetical protein LBB50_06560 [Oscillospiraceae bacterium]|nr:hypothetical protein [Oscillospiraceae bacterium]